MHDFFIIPLVACLVSALCALAIWLQDLRDRSNRCAALLVAGGAWWGFCQTLWTVAPDAQTAYFWHHAATPGWAWIGALCLHLVNELARRPASWMGHAIPWAYGIGLGFAVVGLSTSWLHGAPVRTAWGWGFESGPGHVAFLAFTFACAIPSIWIAVSQVRETSSPAERRQLAGVALGIAAPFLLAGASGGLLPLFGVQVPRLGAISFAMLGLTIAWSYWRYGFSALAPGALSREVLETLPDGVALVGPDGAILSANGRMAELLSVEPDALPGYRIAYALSVDFVAPPEERRDVECTLTDARSEQRPVAVSTSLLKDKQDVPIGIVLVVRDLSEVVALRGHIVASGRLAAVGELAAGLAHEINNPMAFIRANLFQLRRLWQERAEEDGSSDEWREEGDELIGECIEGVDRTSGIVQDLKGFARVRGDRPEMVDVNELLEATLRVAAPQLACGLQVERHLAPVPSVMGSGTELQLLFLNLLQNATHATREESVIAVATALDGPWVRVEIRDEGCGIAPCDRERLFDPLFTPGPAGEGSGLGLAISHQIVRNHRGRIAVESKPEEGTKVVVRLPVAGAVDDDGF